jgi:hypothetical protein
MKKYIVSFNNGCWEDVVSVTVTASSKEEALEEAFIQNPEYSKWYGMSNHFIAAAVKEIEKTEINHLGDDNYSTPVDLQL